MNTLSLLVFGPALLGLLLLFLPEKFSKAGKSLAFLGAVTFFVIGLEKLWGLRANPAALAHERFTWFAVAGLPVEYHLALDGLNYWLVLLTLFLVPLTMAATWNSIQ